MRALLFASVAALALAGCGDSSETAAPEDEVMEDAAETEATAEDAEEAGVAEMDGAEPEPAPDMEEPADAAMAGFTPEPGVAEQRPPNALTLGGQEPAFEAQTRAPIPEETESWVVEEVATGLVHPWALEVLPDGDFLVTERPGQMRIVSTDGTMSDPIAIGVDVFHEGQGGLFDVALAPDFEESRTIYFTFAEPREEGKNGTSLAMATLPEEGGDALEDVQVIFHMQPGWASPGHLGGRIVFEPDGEHMFVTLGERMLADARVTAQTPEDDIGTIVRLNLDGTAADGNPYDGSDNPEVWSYGHRNVQGADLDPVTGRLWTVEHGPRGGDELNHPEPGKNYGWPIIAYGIDYPGTAIGDFITQKEGMEQPVYYWDPVVAPGGMGFYTGDLFPNWKNDLFVAGESSRRLSRLTFNEDRTMVAGEEWLPIGERTREVKTGPDGALYIITDEDNGRLLRIAPG